ncbi:MAG: hypothetical protein QOH96_1115 [Blastocatellia bacterium]|nr:hypothetical protein [Blastocatellia bacterium]
MKTVNLIQCEVNTAMLMLVNGLRIASEIRFDAGQSSLVISVAEGNSISGNRPTLNFRIRRARVTKRPVGAMIGGC